jgi:hypothetical protein
MDGRAFGNSKNSVWDSQTTILRTWFKVILRNGILFHYLPLKSEYLRNVVYVNWIFEASGAHTCKKSERQNQLNNHILNWTVYRFLSKFFSPTDTQLDSIKNNFKFSLKMTLKGCYMFRCKKHHPLWPHTYAATPPNEPRQCILTHFNNCNFSKAQTVCSLRMVFFTPKHVGVF